MKLNTNQKRAVKFLQENQGAYFDFKQINKALGIRNTWLQLKPLIEEGLIGREKRRNGGLLRYFYRG